MNTKPFTLAVSLALATLASPPTQAITTFWVCDNDWWDSICWSDTPGGSAVLGQPLNGDRALLRQSDAVNRTVDYQNTAYPGAVLDYLLIDATGMGTMTLSQAKDSLAINSVKIGDYGTGIYNQTGGTLSVSGISLGGYISSSSGSYTLSGSGNLSAYSESVGSYNGAGTFTQSGGTNTTQILTLGDSFTAGTSGSYALSGNGSLSAKYEYLGNRSAGIFTQSGGTNVTQTLSLGYYAGSSGSYTLSSGSLSVSHYEYIGYDGNGWNEEYNDYGGNGTFIQTGGTHSASYLQLGQSTGDVSSGDYVLSGGSLSVINEEIRRGDFTQTGGTHSVTGTLSVGTRSGSSGSYTLGSGSLSARDEYIGAVNGTGTFTQTGGTHSVTNTLTLNGYGNFLGSYTLSGGSLSVFNEFIRGTGAFTQTGGTHTVNGIMYLINGLTPYSTGSYSLVGGVLTVSNGIQNGGLSDPPAQGLFYVGGGTTVTVGGDGFVNLARLQGSGTIVGNLASGGTVSPGASPGILTVSGDYIQSSAGRSGILDIEIGGLLAGTEYDVLNITGTATLNGTLKVSLIDLGGGPFSPQLGDSFDILTAEMLSGQFTSLSFAYAPLFDPNHIAWRIDYLIDAIGTTDVVRLSVVEAVPIPATMWLFGSGLLGLLGVARRRQAA